MKEQIRTIIDEDTGGLVQRKGYSVSSIKKQACKDMIEYMENYLEGMNEDPESNWDAIDGAQGLLNATKEYLKTL